MAWLATVAGIVALVAGCAAVTPAPGGTPAPGATEGFGLTPDTSPTISAEGAPLVAFYGDSYTLGTGASDVSKRWSTIICADRGWNEFNPSVNGLGFVNNRSIDNVDEPAQIIAQKPDIVMVTMGLNDNFSYARVRDEEIRSAIADDFARLNTTGARIIVVEPFWYTDQRPESVDIIIGWVHDAADAIGAEWIPDASHWLDGHPEWKASDGLHPNDGGYAEMARRMDTALTTLGL